MIQPEFHIFIVWENGKSKLPDIITDIKENFEFISIEKIIWSKKNFARNLSRFYGQKLPSKRGKIRETGTGPLHLIFLKDCSPVYDWRETSRGTEIVNVNMFDAKQKYRSWTGGGHKIHGTISERETQHDLILLTGHDPIAYADKIIKIASAKYDHNNIQDLQGANGWSSFQHMLTVLNCTLNYVVLRNQELITDDYTSDTHGDIDLLVDSKIEAQLILNATKKSREKNRVNYIIKVAGNEIDIDLRHIGDQYYCDEWCRHILKTRVKIAQGMYVPSIENKFYTLLYHALIHKRKSMAEDYPVKLKSIYNEMQALQINTPVDFNSFYEKLLTFLEKRNYKFVKPKDQSVFFDKNLADLNTTFVNLEKSFPLSNLKPLDLTRKSGSEYILCSGLDTIKKSKVIVKVHGIEQSAQNEYFALKALYNHSNEYFAKPLYFSNTEKLKMVCYEFIEGKTLEEVIELQVLSKENASKIVNGLHDIQKILVEKRIIHRDIKLTDIIIKSNFDPCLIDFQFAISPNDSQLKENKKANENFQFLLGLGGDFKPASLVWDDKYSFNKIINLISRKSDLKDPDYIMGKTIKAYYKKPNIIKDFVAIFLTLILSKRSRRSIINWKLKTKLKFHFH